MATIDWEERVFQLASSLYASNFDEMDAESAIANALHFKTRYIEMMGLEAPKPEKKAKEKDELFEDAWILFNRKGSKKKASEQWHKLTEDEKKVAIEHIPMYVSTRELQYQKDFERYLRDKCFNNIVFHKGQVIFDPNAEATKKKDSDSKLIIGGEEYR